MVHDDGTALQGGTSLPNAISQGSPSSPATAPNHAVSARASKGGATLTFMGEVCVWGENTIAKARPKHL